MVDRLNPYEPPTTTGDSPGDIAVGSKPRQPILASLAVKAAVLPILRSSVATMVTYVPSARASGLRFGLTCGVIGIGLIAASWYKLPRGGRIFAMFLLVPAGLGVLDCGLRLSV